MACNCSKNKTQPNGASRVGRQQQQVQRDGAAVAERRVIQAATSTKPLGS